MTESIGRASRDRPIRSGAFVALSTRVSRVRFSCHGILPACLSAERKKRKKDERPTRRPDKSSLTHPLPARGDEVISMVRRLKRYEKEECALKSTESSPSVCWHRVVVQREACMRYRD